MIITEKIIESNGSEVSPAGSDDEFNEEITEPSDDDASKSNAKWADSIAKILKTNKPKRKKTLVLSKAKKLTDIERQKVKPAGFQVATADGRIREEKVETVDVKPEQECTKKKKRELPSLRIKPNILEKDRERTLAKIATKGVVQLFNAVRMQQKDISKKLEGAGPLEARKEKVLRNIDKRAFLDVLMGEKLPIMNDRASENRKLENQKDNTTWNILRDDFMMGAKLKDWDKEVEEAMEIQQEIDIEFE